MAMQSLRKSLPDKITPPGSFIITPLTPPPTDSKATDVVLKVLEILRHLRDGGQLSGSQWQQYTLQRVEYEDLISLVWKEESLSAFVENKIRWDYDSSAVALILRMLSHLHEVFLARVVEEIQSRLRLCTLSEGQSKHFAQKIRYNGSGSLKLRSGNSDGQAVINRQPDATFKHSDAHWPGIVIEVSFSQKTEAIPHLADDYILETNGSVRVVIELDIDYKTRQGSISMWRPSYGETEQGGLELEAAQTLHNQVFRDETGAPNLAPEAGLRLDLKDFAPEDLANGISDSFLIDSALLCQFLNEAEQEEQETKQQRRIVQQLLPGAKKRRRNVTPPDEVCSDDELAIEGRRVRPRESEDDSSYQSSQEETSTQLL